MPAHWLVYWVPEQINAALEDEVLNHAQGRQLERVRPGETLWIIGRQVPEDDLITVGYIRVNRKMNAESARSEFGDEISYFADVHVKADPEDVCRPKKVSLRPIYEQIRFESKTSKTLALVNGQPPAQQLQTNRRLTPESAELIRRLWRSASPSVDVEERQLTSSELANELEKLDQLRTTLTRTEQQLVRRLLINGENVARCALCADEVPVELLVAAHIKARHQCSDAEKRDRANITLMCTLGCDTLFERGYVSVQNGKTLAGPKAPQTDALKQHVARIVGRRCSAFNSASAKYFAWRLQQFERGQRAT